MRKHLAIAAIVSGVGCLHFSLAAAGPINEISVADRQFLYSLSRSSLLRWPLGANIVWSYNPAGQPGWLTTEAAIGYLNEVVAQWGRGCNVNMSVTATGVKSGGRDGENSIYWGNANGFSGFTNSYINSVSRSESDIVLDATRITTASRFRGIMQHETGHAIGLGHSSTPRSIMWSDPYHPGAMTTEVRGDDFAACAAMYGSRGLVAATDHTQTVADAATEGQTLRPYLATSQPASSAVPETTLTHLAAPTSQTLLYAVLSYTNLPVGAEVSIRLIAPDGGLYNQSDGTVGFTSGYRWGSFTSDSTGSLNTLPGNWEYQVWVNGRLKTRTPFTVTSNFSLPAAGLLELRAVRGASGWTLSHSLVGAAYPISTITWYAGDSTVSSGSATPVQTGTFAGRLDFFGTSTRPRYDGAQGSGSNEGQGADYASALDADLGADGSLIGPAVRSEVSGTPAATTLRVQASVPTASQNQVFIVASLAGNYYSYTAGGWVAGLLPYTTLTGPTALSVRLLDGFDTRGLPAGTAVYIGHGRDLNEMVATGRYALAWSR